MNSLTKNWQPETLDERIPTQQEFKELVEDHAVNGKVNVHAGGYLDRLSRFYGYDNWAVAARELGYEV